MIKFNRFANAYTKAPAEQSETDWAGLCARLTRLAKTTAKPGDPKQRKKELPAWTAADMAEAYNNDENTRALTALPIDVDTAPDSLIEVLEASCLDLFVYASPSDPNPDGTRRLRIVANLSRPIAPAEVEHTRLALAEHLGIGPGQGVESAKAVSQVMFAGRLHGTPARDVWKFDGDPLDVDQIMATKLAAKWKVARKGKAKATDPLPRVAFADADERTAGLLASIAEHWEAPGEATDRRSVLRALGGYLARRGWTDEQIAAVGRGLETKRPERDRVGLMVQCARATRASDGETGAGWSGLTAWDPDAAALIEAHAKDPYEPADFVGIWSKAWAAVYARPGSWVNRGHERRELEQAVAETVYAPPTTEDSTGAEVPLLLHDSRYGLLDLLWEGDDLGYQTIARNSIKMRVRELGYQTLIPLRDDKGRSRSIEAVLDEQASTFKNTSYTFAQSLTTYDPTGDRSVTVGFRVPAVAARFDADVDTWLRALGGEHYDRLAVWIASCAQGAINRLSACLVLIGRADSGKSMFGQAVGMLWGDRPVAANRLVEDFNSDLRRNPILVDEEAQLFGSRKLSTKKFRDEIQATSRSVQYKGKERVPLLGAMRLVVSCNGLSDLKFADLGGPSVIEALRDRLLTINATDRNVGCSAALARLRLPNEHRVNLARVTAHMAWLCETIVLPAERFLGAGGSDSDTAILAGHVDDTIDVWERFRCWLDSDTEAGPWYSLAEGLAVDTAALAEALAETGRGWAHAQIRAALAPFHMCDVRPRLDNGARPRCWALDALRLADALGLTVDELTALERRLEGLSGKPAKRSRFGRFA